MASKAIEVEIMNNDFLIELNDLMRGLPPEAITELIDSAKQIRDFYSGFYSKRLEPPIEVKTINGQLLPAVTRPPLTLD